MESQAAQRILEQSLRRKNPSSWKVAELKLFLLSRGESQKGKNKIWLRSKSTLERTFALCLEINQTCTPFRPLTTQSQRIVGDIAGYCLKRISGRPVVDR